MESQRMSDREPVTIDQPPAVPAPAQIQPPQPSQAVALRAASPLDAAPEEFRKALARRKENRKALVEWIREALVDGVDFGAVPLRRGGFSKPSLRKPGAEKICGMLNVVPRFPTLSQYEQLAMQGVAFEQIILRCELIGPDGQVVAEGIGARSVAQDFGDLNKAFKMAEKSAHIDATLRMAGLSEIFTQDLEDMPPGALEGDSSLSAAPRPSAPPAASHTGSRGGTRLATEKQVKLIRVRLDQAAIPESEFCEKFGIEDVAELPFSRVNEALLWISGVAA